MSVHLFCLFLHGLWSFFWWFVGTFYFLEELALCNMNTLSCFQWVRLLFLCPTVHEYPLYSISPTLLTRGSYGTCFGQLNVSRSIFVTSGLKLELPVLSTFSFPLPQQLASADDGCAFSWGTRSEGDSGDSTGVETPTNLQENMSCGWT